MGDGVQAMKAGIMEIGDVCAINKADRDGVLRTERELEMLLSISERPDGWTPPIVKTVATEGNGTELLADAIVGYKDFTASHPQESSGKRERIAQQRIIELLRERLLQVATTRSLSKEQLHEMAASVAERRRDPYSVVDEIIARMGISQ